MDLKSYEKQLAKWKVIRANRFLSISDYLRVSGGDFDSSDMTHYVIVTCCEPFEYDDNDTPDPSDAFSQYIYDNVNVIQEENEKYNTICDWEGFVYKHYDTLYKFAEERWCSLPVDCLSEDDFVYEWIKEIHGWLAGRLDDKTYSTLLEALRADEGKPDCQKYLDYYEKEIAPYYHEGRPIKTYFEFEYDYESSDFQSDVVGGGYPIHIAVNSDENYVFLTPAYFNDEYFEENYKEALQDCYKYGRKPCYNYEDFNRIARSLTDGQTFIISLEMDKNNSPFPGDQELLYPTESEGRK